MGAVVLRDRKHLAEDGMVVVNINLSAQDGSLLAPPDIITRGFIYVKESGDLMKELQDVATEAVSKCRRAAARTRQRQRRGSARHRQIRRQQLSV